MTEKVNHPDHYGGERNPYEAIKVIEAWDLNFHLGNAIKYICRAGFKDSKIHDLEKAIHYLQNELHHEKDVYFRASQGIPYEVPVKELDGSLHEVVSEKSDC